jgi:hypothetical protein
MYKSFRGWDSCGVVPSRDEGWAMFQCRTSGRTSGEVWCDLNREREISKRKEREREREREREKETERVRERETRVQARWPRREE